MQRLWRREDGVSADATPAHAGLALDVDPLPGDPAVRVAHAPGHLPDVLGALYALDPQTFGPRRIRAGGSFFGRVVKPRESLASEFLLMLLGQGLVVAVELRCRLELQSDSNSSRWERNSSADPCTTVSPRATCSSTATSPACHSLVQNHC